ncbi:hypothetical protein LZ198_35260 [Myxococcus sp. K15C18031901]|uniref:hypothetical protein n=1 Tax=Myxococcus dinghuensis TaxID=2906761 RepID=UPI0020A82E55|nr:hypothetical protein [Myxococcus dinghuensis]MCP3104142.1 hypothetical protein [Myxococcus dinghuensis]
MSTDSMHAMPPEPSSSTPPPSSRASRQDEGTAWLGTVLGWSAWAMFFVSLVFAVGWFRMRAPWPELPISRWAMGGTGLALLVGNGLLPLAVRRDLREPSATPFTPWVALGLGLVFLALQATWTHLAWWNEHLRIPEGGVPASAFYGLTALHALHVVGVMFGFFLVAVRHLRGADVRASLRRHVLGWRFVSGMWLFLFAAVYLP